jgi:hypothetical protein
MSFAQTCIVTCTDNDRVIDAEVIEFRQASHLTISLEREIKLVLKYDAHRNHYYGHMSGLELVSDGPTELRRPNTRR